MQVPVISTSHLPQDQCNTLYEGALMRDVGGQTCLFNISEPETFESYPAETVRLINYFSERGYHYLRLDPDGDIVEGLPLFEW